MVMEFKSKKILIGMAMTFLFGQVTTESTGDAVCDKCLRGNIVELCGGCGGDSIVEIDGNLFYLKGDSVACKENNGTEYHLLKKRMEKIVRKEKKRPKSIWPCLNLEHPTFLWTFRIIIMNIGLCHKHLQPLMEQMHEKFAKNKESGIEIFTWLKAEFWAKRNKGLIDLNFSGYLNHSLHWYIVYLKERDVEGLEKMFGPKLGKKCMKLFTKSCRCM